MSHSIASVLLLFFGAFFISLECHSQQYCYRAIGTRQGNRQGIIYANRIRARLSPPSFRSPFTSAVARQSVFDEELASRGTFPSARYYYNPATKSRTVRGDSTIHQVREDTSYSRMRSHET